MKITSETTSMEVKERMKETLQTMCNVEKNKSDVSNHTERVSEQIQNGEISSVVSEMIEEDKMSDSFSYFLDKVCNGFSSEEQKTLDLLKEQRNSKNSIGSKIKKAINQITKEKYEKEIEEIKTDAADNTSMKIISIAQVIQNMYNENQQPEMRLYGLDEKYFGSIDELLKYCRQNKLSTQGLTVLDYYRHFGNFNDVIRKINNESSMFYVVPNERGICWYSDELNHDTEDWEFNHGTIRDLYKPFRDYGVVFEDDIYAKEDERNQKILKYYKENNLFNMEDK